jgi:hypothetical protein
MRWGIALYNFSGNSPAWFTDIKMLQGNSKEFQYESDMFQGPVQPARQMNWPHRREIGEYLRLLSVTCSLP